MEKLDETASVISVSKVTGTEVYNTDVKHLGEIHDVMIDKQSGTAIVKHSGI
jgi:sporulation protein YlmC with PRC-barrel domain